MVSAILSTAAALPTSCGVRRKSRARWLVQVRFRRRCSAGVKLITALDNCSAAPQGLEAEILFQINLIKSEKHVAIDLNRAESLTNCRRKDWIHQPFLFPFCGACDCGPESARRHRWWKPQNWYYSGLAVSRFFVPTLHKTVRIWSACKRSPL